MPRSVFTASLNPREMFTNSSFRGGFTDLELSLKMFFGRSIEVYKMTGGVGSWLYMAPEVVRPPAHMAIDLP